MAVLAPLIACRGPGPSAPAGERATRAVDGGGRTTDAPLSAVRAAPPAPDDEAPAIELSAEDVIAAGALAALADVLARSADPAVVIGALGGGTLDGDGTIRLAHAPASIAAVRVELDDAEEVAVLVVTLRAPLRVAALVPSFGAFRAFRPDFDDPWTAVAGARDRGGDHLVMIEIASLTFDSTVDHSQGRVVRFSWMAKP